jgi:hypothetical protein
VLLLLMRLPLLLCSALLLYRLSYIDIEYMQHAANAA